MNHLNIKISTAFKIMACFFSVMLSMPIIKGVVFRESNSLSILDEISASSFTFSGDFVNVLATFTLIIPYFIDVYIFRPFTIADYSIVAFVINIIIVSWFFSNCFNTKTFLLKIFLIMPASLMIFGSGNKEIYAVIALVIFMLQFDKGNITQGMRRISVYPIFFYALFFRPYYFMLAVCLKFGRTTLSIFLLLLFFLLSVNIDLLSPILDGILNRRSLEQSYEANSAIEQVYFVQDNQSFFYHLIDSFLATCVPLLSSLSLKNLFMQIYIVITILLAALSKTNIIKGMFVLWLFFILTDPDLGAFLRHIGALFPLFKGVKLK